jgi:predicted RND superfamily exporter protein
MNDSRTARLFYDDAARVDIKDRSYYSTSEGFIFVEMIALMKADAVKAILLVTFITALLVLTFVRSFTGMAIVLAPALLGVLITVAVMGAVGPNLSIMNMVILPFLIGIAVDNSIHIYHRYAHDLPKSDIVKIMNSTGRAAALTTLTTLIGFGGMVTASMGGLRSMGTLAIIGFLLCLLMTWLLLPLLLNLHQTRYLKKVAQNG